MQADKTNTTNAPIFVVGAPRSGTTLLAAMLSAHSRLSCGPETRFFRFLSDVDPDELCSSRSWPDTAVDFLFSIILIDPIPQHYGLHRGQIANYLRERKPGIPVILSALTEQFMEREEKSRWVEKSPEHLWYVEEIRKYFPESPIIRIIRDPRDVSLSMTKTPWAPQDYLEALLLWSKYDDRSAAFFQWDRNCYTVSYEKLIQSPDLEMMRLCDFIQEKYEPHMLDTSKSANKVVTEHETWKGLVSEPISGNRIFVWKRELSEELNQITEALIGDRLIKYGYACGENLINAASVYPGVESLLSYRQPMKSLIKNNVRFWRRSESEKNQILVFVGDPDSEKWFSYKKPDRIWDILRVLGQVMLGRILCYRIYWLRNGNHQPASGFAGRFFSIVFSIAENHLK